MAIINDGGGSIRRPASTARQTTTSEAKADKPKPAASTAAQQSSSADKIERQQANPYRPPTATPAAEKEEVKGRWLSHLDPSSVGPAAAETPTPDQPVAADVDKPPPGFSEERWQSIPPDDRQAILDGYAKSASAVETAQTAAVTEDEAAKQALIAAAEKISAKAQESPPYNPTAEELQVLFAAAEAQTGVSAQLLKAISFGEAIAVAYPDKLPRQFFDTELAPNLADRAEWAKEVIGVDLPLTFGDDREFGSQTCGLGICQLTFGIDQVKKALDGENEGMLQVSGGGRPGLWWEGEPVMVDVNRAIVDPYYNIVKAAELINHKISIYSDPKRPGGPISWMPSNPQTPEEWALAGSTYQTYGGYGPGGGATARILKRMTDPTADAYEFANAQPDLAALEE
ncbi:MAG: hypothetical protein JXR83_04425 [Deltaproteobacteria bacterium]|nr:hypothetical protein [Deltaproteobacteria bacterium]